MFSNIFSNFVPINSALMHRKSYQTIYFGDKPLRFVSASDYASEPCTDTKTYVCRDAIHELSPANIVKIFATYDAVLCIADDVRAAFDGWASQFKFVRASGGIVVAPSGEAVVIGRSGRWDLPKGHIETGESEEACAVREIEEETGVRGAEIETFLCNTMHAYNVYGEWELKQTAWFLLTVTATTPLTPQRSEGIVQAEWCDERLRRKNMQTAYATIRQVFACYEQIKR